MTAPVTIIGTGLAGYTLAREFRKLDKSSPLRLITGDDGAFYSKPMLSNAFAQNKAPEQLATKTFDQMGDELNAEIHTHTHIDAINPDEKRLTCSDGTVLLYSKLVLAVGAQPIKIIPDGDASDTIVSVNSLDDYRQFREQIKPGQTVAIMGPGLIGCEFANDLASASIKAVVFGPDQWPISTLLPEVAGQALKSALENSGIQFHLGCVASRVDKADQQLAITLDNGEQIVADHLLSAVGLRADTRLAKSAGLTVNRGIVTDKQLATSDSSIYALGDCAEIDGKVQPFVMPIMHAARALAKTLSGNPTDVQFPPMPVAIKTPALPITVLVSQADDGAWTINDDEGDVSAHYYDTDGALSGFVLTGSTSSTKQTLMKQINSSQRA